MFKKPRTSTHKKNNTNKKHKSAGFTLIELLIAISLLALAAGVTADILLTLVRSYNKTRITNELEQGGNVATTKIEKELRVGTTITSPTSGCSDTLEFTKQGNFSDITIRYVIINGNLTRSVDGSTPVPVIDSSQEGSIRLDSTSEFCVLTPNVAPLTQVDTPDVVYLKFDLVQSTASGGVSFEGNVPLRQAIVMRGSY